ncbi:MAG: trypsin-like peptidase domain-containing protein [Akkermansiaceae bacterium]|nr:trypsin-like peptidase domain-containing protein [Akkermansiaceae bacterium]
MKTPLRHFLTGTAGTAILALTVTAGSLLPPAGNDDSQPLVRFDDSTAAATPQTVVDLTAATAAAMPSIVTLEVGPGHEIAHRGFGKGRQETEEESDGSLGTGVIISSTGHLVTNHHVIESGGNITVTLADGRSFPATILGSDEESDLALLKIEATDLHPARFADSDTLRLGQPVAAIGNPFGVGVSVSSGIISALGRHGTNLTTDDFFIQTDAALNPGNSGGALIDVHGRVIGINTAIYSRTGAHAGIGFAVPSVTVQSVCEQLRLHGNVRRGMLGVTMETTNQGGDGIGIEEIAADSPAARAGLRRGDRIIAIDDETVTSPAELRNRIRLLREGGQVTITVLRGTESIEIPVTLDSTTTALQDPRRETDPEWNPRTPPEKAWPTPDVPPSPYGRKHRLIPD